MLEDKLRSIEITEEAVVKELGKLRDVKSAGANELTSRFLNSIKGGISYPLTLFFQRIMQDEEVPDDWREANVVPVSAPLKSSDMLALYNGTIKL